MNLHLLRIFHTVVVDGSFSRAAETLHVSQPAVSRAVKELENQLDLPLIERSGGTGTSRKGVQLTANGNVIFDHARGIFALEKAAIEDIHARVGLKRGSLVIGASTTIAGYWLSPYLVTFANQYPAIDIQVVVGNTQSISQQLVDCHIDIGLVEGTVNDPRIICERWRDDQLAVVEATFDGNGIERKVEDLNDPEVLWVVRENGSGTREVSEQFFEHEQITPVKKITMGSNEAIINAIVHGLGRALLPKIMVDNLLKQGCIREVSGSGSAPLSRPLFKLHYQNRPQAPLVTTFAKLLQ